MMKFGFFMLMCCDTSAKTDYQYFSLNIKDHHFTYLELILKFLLIDILYSFTSLNFSVILM